MKLSVILKAMAASGATVDALITVAEAHEAEEESAREEKRRKDAERKRRQRSHDVTLCHADSEGQTVTDGDGADAEIPSEKEIPPTPPKEKTNNINNLTARVREGLETLADSEAEDEGMVPCETLPPKKLTAREELMRVLDAEHADAFIEHRKKIKKPKTAYAARKQALQFERAPPGMTPNDAADFVIENGWQGFRPEHAKNVQQYSNNRAGSDGSKYDDFLAAGQAAGDMDDLREVRDFAEDSDGAGRESLPGLRLTG